MKNPERPLLGVSVCLTAGDGRVLLVTRGRPPLEGLLSLPGGKVEFGETVEAAVRRELFEETSLEAGELRFVTLHEAMGGKLHAVIAVYAGRLPVDKTPTAGDDAGAISLASTAEVDEAERAGKTTPGLSAIVHAAADVMARKNGCG